MKLKKSIIIILIILTILSIVSLIMGIWLGVLQSFRIVFGVLYVMFLPGLIWSYVFFKPKSVDNKKKEKFEIDIIERIILSIALSIALVPLTIFFLNKLGIKITLLSTFLEILGLIILSIVIYIIKIKLKK